MKKYLAILVFLILMMACVITPPDGLLPPTPTICVECVQATICAENETGDGCPPLETSTPAIVLPTLIPTTLNTTLPATPTDELLETETPEFIKTLEFDGSPSPTDLVALTQTVSPEATLSIEITETLSSSSTKTPTAAATIREPSWVYKTQSGSPKFTTNFAHPDKACNWGGIAGQVFGSGGAPQNNLVLVVTGAVNGVPYDMIGFTGSAVKYGASAYEIEFPEGPIKTTDVFNIQLFGLDGQELSAPLPFDTYTECDKNLVIYNFTLIN